MSDEGAATSLCSVEFVQMYKLPVLPAGNHTLAGYNCASENDDRFKAVLIMVIQGDHTTGVVTALRVLHRAIVVSPMTTPRCCWAPTSCASMGVINDHGASLSTFQADGREIEIACAPWSEVQQSTLRIQHSYLSCHPAVTVANASTTHKLIAKAITAPMSETWDVGAVSHWDRTTFLDKTVRSPRAFLRFLSWPITVSMVVGLFVLARLYSSCQGRTVTLM